MRVLNLFNRELKYISNDMLEMVHNQGFDCIQISPVQPTKEEFNNVWWMLYQPINFSVGNRICSRSDLQDFCSRCKEYGIHVIVDTVINHLAGGNSPEEALTPNYQDDRDLLRNYDAWKHTPNLVGDDWNDRYKVTHYNMGLPGLNPDNQMVRDKVIGFMNDLIDLGVDGFRLDAAKSIALPEEGSDFFPVITYSLKKPVFVIYGEVINTPEEYIHKYAKYMKVLTDVNISHNQDEVVRFAETKDNFLSDGNIGYTKGLPASEITNRYVNLTGNYPNTLYYSRNNWECDEYKSYKVRDANKVMVRK
ncbi:MAG TPA: alpha-amylase family glycosyl hydrolase [Bacilli bacterium]|nr:alpha-amylase family glycosyl hydrolase [Bacilli bacterium]